MTVGEWALAHERLIFCLWLVIAACWVLVFVAWLIVLVISL